MIFFECCNGCKAPKRHKGCHDTCEAYLNDKKKLAEQKERINKEMEIDRYKLRCTRMYNRR